MFYYDRYSPVAEAIINIVFIGCINFNITNVNIILYVQLRLMHIKNASYYCGRLKWH